MDRDGSVGIANHYGLDGQGNRITVGDRFSVTVVTVPTESTHPHAQWVNVSLAGGVKRPGRGFDHLIPSSANVKEVVELYLYCLCAFMASYTVNFTTVEILPSK
jgi:hypothetical protein